MQRIFIIYLKHIGVDDTKFTLLLTNLKYHFQRSFFSQLPFIKSFLKSFKKKAQNRNEHKYIMSFSLLLYNIISLLSTILWIIRVFFCYGKASKTEMIVADKSLGAIDTQKSNFALVSLSLSFVLLPQFLAIITLHLHFVAKACFRKTFSVFYTQAFRK